jgi:hypothetical protein
MAFSQSGNLDASRHDHQIELWFGVITMGTKMPSKNAMISISRIEFAILTIRGLKVMLDSDLAELYGVLPKALNQAVKRNQTRFPDDFMFRLDRDEKQEVVTNCYHI